MTEKITPEECEGPIDKHGRIPESVSFMELKIGQDLGDGETVLDLESGKIKTAQRTPEGIQFRHYKIEVRVGGKYDESSEAYRIIDFQLRRLGR